MTDVLSTNDAAVVAVALVIVAVVIGIAKLAIWLIIRD